MGTTHLEIESDSLAVVVQLLKLNIVSNNFLSSILIECWQLMQKLEYFVSNIFTEK